MVELMTSLPRTEAILLSVQIYIIEVDVAIWIEVNKNLGNHK